MTKKFLHNNDGCGQVRSDAFSAGMIVGALAACGGLLFGWLISTVVMHLMQ